MRLISLCRISLLTVGLSLLGFGQDAPAGFRGEVLKQIADAEKKTIALAEATPQDKYKWRPADNVRSTSEVFMHIAGANYMIPTFIGAKSPDGLRRDMEKTVTDKTQVVDMLKKSFAHVREAVLNTKDGDLNTPVTLFGSKTTKRGTLLLISDHLHEHLGQSIAYARMNGITPPWSQGRSE